MGYILHASQASLISAGESLPEQDREVQQCLTLIETAIRQKAREGLNKVHLLDPHFAGWDKNNIKSGPSYMSAVFDALLSNGYGFFTEPSVPVHESMGPVLIPYVHTSVTWGKVKVDKSLSDKEKGVIGQTESTIIETDDRRVVTREWLDEQIRKRDNIAGEWVLEPTSLSEVQPMSVNKDFDADSMNENIAPVCISKGAPPVPESDLGADEAYFREATTYAPEPSPPAAPMPGHPAQLVNYLRNLGFALKGFGAPHGFVHKPQAPYSWETGQLIYKVTASLLESHRRGVHERSVCAIEFDPSRVEVTRIQEEFKNFGFDLIKEMSYSEFAYVWPVDAWDRFEPAPVPAQEIPTVHSENPFPMPVSRIGKFVVALRACGFTIARSKDMFSQDLLDREAFEGSPETAKAYENVLECLLEAVKKGECELKIKLSIGCVIGRIVQYLKPLGFACDWTVHPYRAGEPAYALLIIKWSAIKC